MRRSSLRLFNILFNLQLVNSLLQKIRYYIKEASWIARIAAWKLNCTKVAIVMGNTIHLYNTNRQEFLANTPWHLHELKHIEQFRRHGFTRFILLYLWESIRYGYTQNKYEREARAAEKEEQLLEITQLQK